MIINKHITKNTLYLFHRKIYFMDGHCISYGINTRQRRSAKIYSTKCMKKKSPSRLKWK